MSWVTHTPLKPTETSKSSSVFKSRGESIVRLWSPSTSFPSTSARSSVGPRSTVWPASSLKKDFTSMWVSEQWLVRNTWMRALTFTIKWGISYIRTSHEWLINICNRLATQPMSSWWMQYLLVAWKKGLLQIQMMKKCLCCHYVVYQTQQCHFLYVLRQVLHLGYPQQRFSWWGSNCPKLVVILHLHRHLVGDKKLQTLICSCS